VGKGDKLNLPSLPLQWLTFELHGVYKKKKCVHATRQNGIRNHALEIAKWHYDLFLGRSGDATSAFLELFILLLAHTACTVGYDMH
jgi:hypothetical protein